MTTPSASRDPDLPKQNRGNRRTGSARNAHTHRGRHKGPLNWREDPLILSRIALTRRCMAQGYTASGMLPTINLFMVEHEQPEVTLDTVYSDRARMRELQVEERATLDAEADGTIAAHMEALSEVQREAWRAFHDANAQSLNRSAYLNTIKGAVELQAKLDGSMVSKVLITHDRTELDRIREAMEAAIPDPEARRALALRIVRGDTPEPLQARVIDVESHVIDVTKTPPNGSNGHHG